MKKCFKCGLDKSLSEFYKHPRMKDGYLNKCKICSKKEAGRSYEDKKTNPSWMEKERTRGRERYRRLYMGVTKSDVERNRRYLDKYPEKKTAKDFSANLIAPFDGAERHHWSYNSNHFKDVIWVVKKDHMKAHRFIVYDQERKMYRRFDTNELLDTKEKHESFILACVKNKED